MTYVEPGGSWRPFWLAAAALAVLVAADAVLPDPDVPPLLWLVGAVFVLGTFAAGAVTARRTWTVRVDAAPDPALSVGRERVPLADVDARHLRAVRGGRAGGDVGAPVLGGGGSIPRGRTGLPLTLTDGRTVLVPTRNPAALTTALLAAHPDTRDGHPGKRGTLGS
ncbi:hypothetical protein DQ238_20570 [Geodermatophilus sp. TF02-6]|uniref:hypothetical protein n=1 Tax=Geodermatophilus sp. TF02-6 TaxID=2250575 RepID=UPI000DEA4EF7|nr:hypothetical protein [Geodermatophilus sp. TF02-6]RBY75026.1 hypothetical protein DQ238_20570 [Geodermatophilus sp. TF02-6]